MSEEVLCVPTSLLHECGYFEGFTSSVHRYEKLFNAESQDFQRRSVAETNELAKQLIPYVIIVQNGSIAAYRRGASSGEKRLHGKRSIGFGGHINPVDANASSSLPVCIDWPWPSWAYLNGMLRELTEELRFSNMPSTDLKLPIVGLINDDSSPVGRVHLGVVHVLQLELPASVIPREDAISDMGWHTDRQLCSDYEDFEEWSRYCLLKKPWL